MLLPAVQQVVLSVVDREKLAIEAGVDRANIVVVPDPQSGTKLLQDGRIDVYTLPVLSISDLLKKAEDPSLSMFAPVETRRFMCWRSVSRKTVLMTHMRAGRDEGQRRVCGDHRTLRYWQMPLKQTRENLCGGELNFNDWAATAAPPMNHNIGRFNSKDISA